MKKYTLGELSRYVDHTNLKPDATDEDIENLCDEALKYNFKMVAINQVQSKLCSEKLKNTDIGVGAAIAFPLGQTSIEAKVFETEDAIQNGATEIDYVLNVTEVKNGNLTYIKDEMIRIVDVCRKYNVTNKVIFENCYLTDNEIIALSKIAKEVEPNFIKTSTGFGPSGATIEDVKLMKKYVGDRVKVKAAGGIRDAESFIQFIQAGVERIGASSGIQIIEEIKQKMADENAEYIEI